ncbi:MAG: T9SS type A sorting domain-containing protein [Flavobacteriales bacterium]
MHRLTIFFTLFFIVQYATAQIVVEPLGSNDIKKNQKVDRIKEQKKTSRSSLALPFVEDFSYPGPYPRSDYWADSSAFINWDFPIQPPSIGVATFDGLDKFGNPYSTIFEEHGPADTLTSREINLNLAPADSVYFSFFYQPKGRGNYPEFEDSLRLEYFSVSQQRWIHAWSTVGQDFPQTDIRFRQVMLPIRDTAFLHDGFRFRFMNFASLHAGYDHWHIDYIRIDKSRNRADSLYNDIAFMDRPPSFLRKYQSMPYRHFKVAPPSNMGDLFSVNVTTLRNLASGYSYKYQIFNESGELRDEILFEPQAAIPYREVNTITREVKYTYDAYPEDYHTFYTEYSLSTEDLNAQNDFMRIDQVFSNYYAYDDGTAEERLSLVANGGGFVAVKYDIAKTDTLRAVQFYFNQVNQGPTDRDFFIMVWNAGTNRPGSLAYTSQEFQPFFPEGVNRFSTFVLDNPPVLQQGIYYIGWAQTRNFRLNVGFDKNLDNTDKIFFNTNGNWNPLVGEEGTLMIRPLFGGPDDVVASAESIEQNTIKVFPNPTRDFFQIDLGKNIASKHTLVEMFDVSGKKVASHHLNSSNMIDCSRFNAGIYLIRVIDDAKQIYHSKILISH